MSRCFKCDSEFSNADTIMPCGHSFCGECLVKYLKDLKTPKVKCLVRECTSNLPDKIIREYLTDDQIYEFNELCMSSCSSNVLKCLTKGCPYFIACEDSDLQFVCEICKSPNCITCKRRHYATDCGVDTSDENEIEFCGQATLKKEKRSQLMELLSSHDLLPNPSSFECPICYEFITPRKGVILRNCLHNYCKKCLRGSMGYINYISQMICIVSNCNAPLHSIEILALMGDQTLATMMIREASSRFYLCNDQNCTGMWDATNTDGSYQCHVCHQNNCMACNDIHDGMSCDAFRRTRRYIQAQGGANILSQYLRVTCFICLNELLHDGGCSDIHCDRCGNFICIFTGKIVRLHDPQKCYCQGSQSCTKIGYFCDCTPSMPCHRDCDGCIPEQQ